MVFSLGRSGGTDIAREKDELIAAVETDLEVAWAIGEAFPDQDFSLVDRTSFAVMQRLAVYRAASFDAHFAIYRFGPDRRQTFEVLG